MKDMFNRINLKHKIILLFTLMFALFLIVCIRNNAYADDVNPNVFDKGTGTERNPYIIETKQQLDAVRNDLSACYKLNKDLVFTEADYAEGGDFYNDSKGWEPIGTVDEPFKGNLDGNGHIIKNIGINRSSEKFNGLFGYSEGNITYLGAESFHIEGRDNLGCIAGMNTGNISECYVTGKMSILFLSIKSIFDGSSGGIVGVNDGTIVNCYNDADINEVITKASEDANSNNIIGGVSGLNRGSINNCYNNAYIKGHAETGGISGFVCSAGTVQKCYNTGNIKTYSEGSGGIVGAITNGNIKNCYNTGEVSDFSYGELSSKHGGIGGIAGYMTEDAVIDSCYNTGNIKNVYQSYPNVNAAGGIVGTITDGNIKNCYNTGKIGGTDFTGGIAGYNGGYITACYNIGMIEGKESYYGEITGLCWKSTTDCYFLDRGIYGHGGIQNIKAATPCSIVELKSLTTYSGFDFINVWEFNPENEYWLPTLKGMTNYAVVPEENSVEFAGGYGTVSEPYIIESKEQLDNIRRYPKASYRLDCDIVFDEYDFSEEGMFYNEGEGWMPIGDDNIPFSGIFDGNGHIIRNIWVNRPGEQNVGLFGCVTGGIQKLGMVDSMIVGSYSVGGIVGRYNGSYKEKRISNCYNTGDVRATYKKAGGIVGSILSSYDLNMNCYNSGNIYAQSSDAGGIVGYVSVVGRDPSIWKLSNCYNVGMITGDGSNVDDIVGYCEVDIVENCYYLKEKINGVGVGKYSSIPCTTKEIKDKNTFLGFDFDNVWTIDPSAEYCLPVLKSVPNYATVELENIDDFERGFGTVQKPYIIKTKEHLNNVRKYLNAYYRLDADVVFEDGDFQKNGIFYNNGNGWEPIGNENEAFSGTLDGNGHVIKNIKANRENENYAGVFGISTGKIKNVDTVNLSIKGKKYTGGITGENNGQIEKCSVTGNIYSAQNAGGVAGVNKGSIENSYNGAKINAEKNAGGITGQNNGQIEKCSVTGNIYSVQNAGGVAGINTGSIENSYNGAKISAEKLAGGIAGQSSGTINCVYNICKVSSKDINGSIVGENLAEGALKACYYLDQRIAGVGKGIDDTTKFSYNNMLDKGIYSGFDFDEVWNFETESNYKLPVLRGVSNHAEMPGNSLEFSAGRGTAESPYIIKTKEELNNVRNHMDAHYKLIADIAFDEKDFEKGGLFYNEGKGWLPIGDEDNLFTGYFDGNNHMISGLVCRRPKENNIGLFGVSGGTIKYLGMDECQITGAGNSGTIVGKNTKDGLVLDCFNRGDIVSTFGNDIGGIAGQNNGILRNCYNSGNLNSLGGAGGIACRNYGLIELSYNTGNITAPASAVTGAGGVAASNSGEIRRCYNTGQILMFFEKGGTAVAGGITGYNYGTVRISYNTGTISCVQVVQTSYDFVNFGGISGSLNGTIQDCYNIGQIVTTTSGLGTCVGGITSMAVNDAEITRVYNAGKVITVTENVGFKGAIVGGIGDSVSNSLKYCYYRSLGISGVGYGTDSTYGKYLYDMKKQRTYSTFDFNSVWSISSTEKYNLPVLRYLPNEELQYSNELDLIKRPAAPKLKEVTANTIEIKAVKGQMYTCVRGKNVPDYSSDIWRKADSESMKFTGLSDGSAYRIYTYIPAGSSERSNISSPLDVQTVQYGKFTGTGKITFGDVLYLRRALAEWDGYKVNPYAADVNDDGKVSEADAIILERYFAGWRGYEELPYPVR